MSKKEIYAKNTKDYIVTATADGMDYTLDYVGKDPTKEIAGTSPTGLLLNALAGCQLMTARSFFDRQEIDVKDLDVTITGDFKRSKEGWKLKADAVLTVDKILTDIEEDHLVRFIDRFCTVSGVLTPGNEINLTIEYEE